MKIELDIDAEQLAMLSGALGVFKDAIDSAIQNESVGQEVPAMNPEEAGLAAELNQMRG